eukprot:TRINITY_DN866_c0_g1_i1.p1 TRINITY_DN866_c0_g1~~TRINITY_DN866_c0_g1_i1.p1  ORF type:complete len:430 (+),score=72.25 TRINITY_DN866_c0_g1_i1:139-1428(+)
MEKLIHAIHGLSTKDEGELKQLKQTLSTNEELLMKHQGDFDAILGVLDPSVHTLGWIYILYIRSQSNNIDALRFLTQAKSLLEEGSAQQIRLAQSKFIHICRKFTEVAVEHKNPLRAVFPLHQAVIKASTSAEHLTPIHADFLQVCLQAKVYNAALPVLEQEVLDIDPASTGLTPQDMLRYFYYGGIVYIGLKQYKKALEMFKLVLSAPAFALSAIVIESYKKFVLVSLLVHGQVESLPKTTSILVQRNIKSGLPAYSDFANAFSTYNPEETHKVAASHAEAFQKDRNFGIVKQCIKSLYRRNILRHTQTYLTLSLSDIATSVKLESPKEAEKSVLHMIEEGNIFASINQRDGMVSFHEDSEQYNTNEMLNLLDKHIAKSVELAHKIKSLDESVSLSANYIQRTNTFDKATRWGEAEEMMGDRLQLGQW